MRASVIIPCHNADPWIGAALRSVAQQTYPAHEIIVIDDCSADDSLRQIERSGVLVNLLRVNARNAAIARNAGIKAATGDWIALLDADDIWYPNHLARATKLLTKSDDVAFMSNHDWIGLEAEPLARPDGSICKLPAPRSGMNVEDFFRINREGFHFGHSTVLYRLDRVRSVGMFDPSQLRRHDIDLWLRMIKDRSWTYDTVTSVGYRENTPNSLSSAEMECDYFYLRALIKNLDLSSSPSFSDHLKRYARRAVGIAFVDGSSEHYTRVCEMSWRHLSVSYRLAYLCASAWPALARRLIREKRRVMMRGGFRWRIPLPGPHE
jgi:teichuronic acid biosynthesis glycosyltransferase TuaG